MKPEILFEPTPAYNNFSDDHFIPIALISVFFLWLIWMTRNAETDKNFKIAFFISLIPMVAVVSRICFTSYEGSFSIKEELPLHLCRLIAMILPVFIWLKDSKWINTLYFLIIVGTLQAVVTADLQYTMPHYSYFIYWIFHVSLVWIPIFIIIRLRIFPDKQDMVRAFIYGNIYMLLTMIINFSIGSNYFYTRHKPPGGSLLDLFGPWPWYILVAEGLAVVLFILAYLPFYKKENKPSIF
jgi:hypothetical integral membrane protein (TIGR02206 family)